jgi:beta-phosphoglucomutase-like phosphatase (HAD superfamily)
VSYQHILFDYDGCLTDTISVWVATIKQVSAEFGLVLNDEQIAEQCGELSKVRNHGLDERLVLSYRNTVNERARPAVF